MCTSKNFRSAAVEVKLPAGPSLRARRSLPPGFPSPRTPPGHWGTSATIGCAMRRLSIPNLKQLMRFYSDGVDVHGILLPYAFKSFVEIEFSLETALLDYRSDQK